MVSTGPLLRVLLAAAQLAISTVGGCIGAETRVRGIDLALSTVIRGVEAASSGTHPGIGYSYDETASDRANQYNGRVFDPGTGLHDYGARMYWPQIGRFISPDPAGMHLENPQSLNRYAYVWNNPYKYIDPDGRDTQLALGLHTADSALGHVALVVNGRVYSYGTNWTQGEAHVRDWGADAGAYLDAQADRRQTELITLDVDSAKEATLQSYLDTHNPNAVGAKDYNANSNSCVTVSEDALVPPGRSDEPVITQRLTNHG